MFPKVCVHAPVVSFDILDWGVEVQHGKPGYQKVRRDCLNSKTSGHLARFFFRSVCGDLRVKPPRQGDGVPSLFSFLDRGRDRRGESGLVFL